jgi:hypothetical protein
MNADGKRQRFNKRASLVLLILIAVIAAAVLSQVVGQRKDFHNNLWGPAHLLVQGKSPYNTSSLNPELPALWLPMAVGIFAPLGWLSEKVAAQVWFLFNISSLSMIVYLALGDTKPPIAALLTGLSAYFFPTTIQHFALGQFSILAALCLMLAARFAKHQQDWPAAFLLALGCSKPQLGILAVIGLSYFYFERSGLTGVMRFAAKFLTMALIMSLPLFIAKPVWMLDYFANWRNNPTWPQPSIFSILNNLMGNWGILLWAGIALAGLSVCIYIWKRLPPQTAMYWSLGLTPILSPYIWSWDFVLLLPVWIATFAATDWRKKSFLLLSYLIGWVGMAAVQLRGNAANQLFWWVPFWVLGSILLVTGKHGSHPI